ncbi:hypothetical protein BGZ49_000377, partial [Haplosporangium sp. Z 27]
MESTIFNNAIITFELAQYLRLSDLANCVRVSKEWNGIFNPRLWSTIHFKTNFQAGALTRHRNHIRTIEGLCEYVRHLEHPKVEFDQFMVIPTFLRRISIEFSNMTPILEETWITSLDHHAGLEHLELTYTSRTTSPKFLPRLLYMCPHLHTLRLNVNLALKVNQYSYDIYRQEQELVRIAMNDMGHSGLRNLYLSIGGNENLEWLTLLPLLEHTPYLESLQIPTLCHGELLCKMCDIFRSRENTGLKHLCLGTFHRGNIAGIYELFRTMKFERGIRGLQSLEIAIQSGMDISIVPECFGPSLTKLKLMNSYICVLPFAKALKSLPNLKSLEARVRLDRDLYTDTFLTTSWACVQLKNLNLRIMSNSSNVRVVEYVFNQIGRLTDLEILALDGNQYHIEIKDGHLGLLRNLKKLREISVHPIGHALRERDARWFVNHWSCLSLFKVGSQTSSQFYQDLHKRGEYARLIKGLKSRRPWIQIEVGNE